MSANKRVLLINEPGEGRRKLVAALQGAFECGAAGSLEGALDMIGRGTWDVAVAEYELGGDSSGLEVLQAIRDSTPRIYRLLYCRGLCGSLEHDAVRLAQTYAVLDCREPDFEDRLHRVLRKLLRTVSEQLREGPQLARDPETRWVGSAPVTLDFVARLRAAAHCDSPVFITGEPGSGKSLATRLLRTWRQEWKQELQGPPARSEHVIVLRIPPLRERIEDLHPLADRWLWRHADGGPVATLSLPALRLLTARPWMGNVTELFDVLEGSVRRVGPGGTIGVADLPFGQRPVWRPSQHAKDEGQRECLLRQLRAAHYIAAAARLEGATRANYIRLMRRLGIVRADTHPDEPDDELG